MRGEQYNTRQVHEWKKGSPPHARGAVEELARIKEADGITPACAGSSRVNCPAVLCEGDHPRMRGEQSSLQSRASQSRGSPPHARGAGFFRNFLGAAGGITPACAGSSQCKGLTSAFQWDHPRMRGEQQVNDASVPVREGSPPHARGAATGYGGFTEVAGITPACAGSSMEEADERRFAEDHPRMRGEQRRTASQGLGLLGSPPHARGAGYQLRRTHVL